jgi:hypothetical protein
MEVHMKKFIIALILAVAVIVGTGSWSSPAQAQVDYWEATWTNANFKVFGSPAKVSGFIAVDETGFPKTSIIKIDPTNVYSEGLTFDCKDDGTWPDGNYHCAVYRGYPEEMMMSTESPEYLGSATFSIEKVANRKNFTSINLLLKWADGGYGNTGSWTVKF